MSSFERCVEGSEGSWAEKNKKRTHTSRMKTALKLSVRNPDEQP